MIENVAACTQAAMEPVSFDDWNILVNSATFTLKLAYLLRLSLVYLQLYLVSFAIGYYHCFKFMLACIRYILKAQTSALVKLVEFGCLGRLLRYSLIH